MPSSIKRRDKEIELALSHTKLSPALVFTVAINIIVASSSRNEDYFIVKDFFSNASPSDMNNQANTHVFGINFRVYFTTSKSCDVPTCLPEY